MQKLKVFSILILISFLTSCSSMLFFPTKVLYYDPEKLMLKFDEVRIPSYDGTSLYGWYFHHKAGTGLNEGKPKAVIFYAHGNGENISSHFTILSWVLDLGYDFFIFDYRGYGVSGGVSSSPKEAVGDTIAALRWTDLKAKEKGAPLVAFGQSLGSALMVRALIEEKERIHPRYIVLESPFLSYQWAAASVLSQFKITTLFQPFAFLLISDQWAPRERIRELSGTPILIIHGDEDRIVDYRLGVETYDAILGPKDFIRNPDGGHIQAFWGENKEKFRNLFIEKMDSALNSH